MRIGRVAQAQQAIADLRRTSRRQVTADILEAGVHLSAARYDQARQLLGTVTHTIRDDDGYEHSPTSVAEWHAAALVGLGKPGEAADVLLRIVRSEGVLAADVDLFVEAFERAGRPLDELATAIVPSMLPTVVAAAIRLDPERGDRLLEALWQQVGAVVDPKAASATTDPETAPGDPESEPAEPGTIVLAGAAMLGQLLPPMDAGRWSKRLRARGLGALCPLVALSANGSVPPTRRILAACSAFDLGDMAVAGALVDVGGQLGHRTIDHLLPGGSNPTVRLQLERGAALAQPVVRRAVTKDQTPEVSIVVEAKGGAAEVLGCLQALAATLPGDVSFEVVVIDSGSTDGTAAIVDGLSGDVVSVRTALDVGSVRARNLGAEQARGDIVVFVESAARPQPGWLLPLLAAFAADSGIAAVAPVLVDLDGQVRCAGYEVTSGAAILPGAGLHQRPWAHAGAGAAVLTSARYAGQPHTECRTEPVRDVDGLAGAVVAVRRVCFDRVGGFDEEYWNGGAMLDLCFALRAAGDRVVCQPQASAVVGPTVDLAVIPWAAGDPDTVPFAEGVGLRWQLRHNQRRFLDKWEGALARR
jgi:GT2 family glycosyltransferase